LQINVKGKNLELTDSLKSHADQKVKKVSRYSDAVISAEVTLTTERNWHIAKVNLFCKGFDMHAEEKSKDMYNSIDRVVEKLERDLKRQREKETSHRATRGAEEIESTEKETDASKKREEDQYSAQIESIHRFVPQTLTIEAAIKELEAASHQFLCFSSEDDGALTILYKSGRGYSLLHPVTESD
jgi:putative sigma-54 modulation protein